jgi:hypothetical protein
MCGMRLMGNRRWRRKHNSERSALSFLSVMAVQREFRRVYGARKAKDEIIMWWRIAHLNKGGTSLYHMPLVLSVGLRQMLLPLEEPETVVSADGCTIYDVPVHRLAVHENLPALHTACPSVPRAGPPSAFHVCKHHESEWSLAINYLNR